MNRLSFFVSSICLMLFSFAFASHSYSTSNQYCNCDSVYVTCSQTSTVVSASTDQNHCTSLDLSGLSLDSMPQLVNFTQVQFLNISFNNITRIEDSKLTTLCSLQEIYAEGNPFGCPCDDIPISLSLWDYIADSTTLHCPPTFGAEGHFTLFNYSSFCPGGSNATHWYNDCQELRLFKLTLYNASLVDANMTVDMCVSQCDIEGHNYAELFNGTNCYCETNIFGDFTIVNRAAQGKAICNVVCPGDSTEVCGGRNSLSIYQADKSCLRVPPSDRIDCSYEWPDIPNYVCVQRGCCYDSTYPQAIKCFHKAKQAVHNSCDAVGSFSSSLFMADQLTLLNDLLDATEPMSCNGLLVAWEFKVSGNNTCTFNVWRPTGGRFFRLAASTAVSLNVNSIRYNLQPDKQIAVMKGDMIGAYRCETLHLDESQQPTALYVNTPSRSKNQTFVVDEGNEIEVGGLAIRTTYYRLHLRAIINASADIPTDQSVNTSNTSFVKPTLRPVASFCHTSSSSSLQPMPSAVNTPFSSMQSATKHPTVTHINPSISPRITTATYGPMHYSTISSTVYTTVASTVKSTVKAPEGSNDSNVPVHIIAIVAACVGVFFLVVALIVGVAIGWHTAKRRRSLSFSGRHSGAFQRTSSIVNLNGEIGMISNPVHASSTSLQLADEHSYATAISPPRTGTNATADSSGYLIPNESSQSLMYVNETAASEPGYAVLDPNRQGSPVGRSQSPTADDYSYATLDPDRESPAREAQPQTEEDHTYATLDPDRQESPVRDTQPQMRIVGGHAYTMVDPTSLEKSESVYAHKMDENGSARQTEPPTIVVEGHTYAALNPTSHDCSVSVYEHRTDENSQRGDPRVRESSSETKLLQYQDIDVETLEPKHVYTSTAKDVN